MAPLPAPDPPRRYPFTVNLDGEVTVYYDPAAFNPTFTGSILDARPSLDVEAHKARVEEFLRSWGATDVEWSTPRMGIAYA